MRTSRLPCAAVLLVLFATMTAPAPSARTDDETNLSPAFAVTRARPPVRFEPNLGQFADGVRFVARAGRGAVLLEDQGVVFSSGGARVRMSTVGARDTTVDAPDSPLPGVSNYMLGDDPEQWTTGVPGYERVTRRGVYDGVDLALHSCAGRIEYDFEIAPGTDPSVVVLAFDGADAVDVDPDGALAIRTRAGSIRHERPVAYQDIEGERRSVSARFERRDDGSVGFALEEFDDSAPLVVDPVVEFSLIFGGSGDDTIADIKSTTDGGVVLAGWTLSYDIPLAHPIQTDPNESSLDSFVTRLDASGSNLVYSTYLGGRSGDDKIAAIALDPAGSVFVTGLTQSSDFPLASPLRATAGGYGEGFVTELAPDGSALIYSTYVGGEGFDGCSAISVESSGRATVCGYTNSRQFPSVNALKLRRSNPNYDSNFDAFVATIGPRGATLELSTVFGGSRDELPARVVASDGRVTVAGSTESDNFQTVNAFQSVYGYAGDVFVVSFLTGAARPIFSTYLGGARDEYVFGLMCDTNGDLIVAGTTYSANYPTVQPLQVDHDDYSGDAFVTRFAGTGAVIYSTYFGSPTFNDAATDAELASDGSIFLYGITQSLDFPEVDPLQPNPGAGYYVAGFLSRLSGQGDHILMSTYLTGYGYSGGFSLDDSGNFWLMGYVEVADLDIRNPFGIPTFSSNPTLSRFVRSSTSIALDVTAPETAAQGALVTVPVTVANNGPGDAGDVSVRIHVAEGGQLVFVRGATDVTRIRGGSGAGDSVVSLARIGPSLESTVELGILVTGAQGSNVRLNATATTSAWRNGQPSPSDSVQSSVVPQTVLPPVIASTRLSGAGEMFRIRLAGSGFQTGAMIFIGIDTVPWSPAKLKGSSTILLKGGTLLAARFPAGVQIPVRVVNPDGGEATALVIR